MPTHFRSILLAAILLLPSTFYAHESSKSAQVEVLAKSSASWDGKALPHYPQGVPEITLLRITVPPHTALPMHQHPIINAGLLLEGELSVHTPDGRIKMLRAGDSLIELVDQWHYGRNDGEEPAVIVVFYAGIKDEPITVVQPEVELKATSAAP